jgi:DNA-binding NtrC family response regulator
MDRASIQERFGIVGSSAAIRNVIDRARQVSKTDITVLLQGESGVGKELIAEVIHELSPRRHKSMVVVNCGAIPEGLIESELFGAEKGAYTGAVQKRVGYFEEADESTIFLDEIGEMPAAAQVRLLRVLETGRFSRVGSSQQQETDVRIVAATNKDLAKEVKAERFRKDLYYRLSTVLIDIPPLRERRDDILPIFETFLHRFSKEYNSHGKRVTEDAADLLESYHWPGNVRELRNVAEQAVVMLREEEITADVLRPLLRDLGNTGDGAPSSESSAEASSASAAEAPSATSLMRITPGSGASDEGASSSMRERELLYRAILEMRIEMREIKEQLGTLMSTVGVVVPRDVVERSDFPSAYDDFVVVRDRPAPPSSEANTSPSGNTSESMIRDVVYEVDDEDAVPNAREADRSGGGAPSSPEGPPNAAEPPAPPPGEPNGEVEEDTDDLPTLEEAEHELISRALKAFDGNRRKTAEALGISERTLYRKLKDIDEDL